MQRIFKNNEVVAKTRARALELAIDAAFRMNRFAAMDTCCAMVTSVDDDDLGFHVVGVIQNYQHSFITDIEPSQCNCDSIRTILRNLQDEEDDDV